MKISLRILLALLLPLIVSGCASTEKHPPAGTPSSPDGLVNEGSSPAAFEMREFGKAKEHYSVRIHSPEIGKLLRSSYPVGEREKIRRHLSATLAFSLDSRGLARAADRGGAGESDPTHYDAVWVRDNLWVYLGLRAGVGAKVPEARKLLLTLADYFSSPAQVKRFDAVIADPKILAGPGGAMRAVHIRFDRNSPDFSDVSEGGSPQPWNHKQNDALGLFLDLFCRSLLEGEILPADLTPVRLAAIERFPKYFAAVKFTAMADAGSWEEIERVNTSSIGLVTSGLERMVLAKKYFPKVDADLLRKLIAEGYTKIRAQLKAGGESPAYAGSDPHFRKSDAALLNLIYPAQLAGLGRGEYQQILAAVAPLVGEVGIKRYLGDSYQSGNFWFKSAKTDDTSSDSAFENRGSQFIPGSEAQWFFDSWYSIATRVVAERYHDAFLAIESVKYLNRALGQITGGTPEKPVSGADGKPVPCLALPESYNTLVDSHGNRAFAPSPITPLNWAKAALRLAL